MDRVGEIIYKLIHRGPHDIDELAELMGVSTNYVYRMGLPSTSESHSDIGIRRLIAIMKAQNDTAFVRYLAKRFGGMFVKVPRVARDRREGNEIIADYQETATRAV